MSKIKREKVKLGRQRFYKTEFDDSYLPSNRFTQFFDVIKIEWRTLFLVGFILLLTSLPLILTNFFSPFFQSSFITKLTNDGATNEEIQSMVNFIKVIAAGINVLSFGFIGFGIACVSNIMKNLVYGEGFIFRFDLISGIKNNGKFFVISSLVLGFINFLVDFNSIYLSNSNSFMLEMINFLTIALFYIFIVPIFLFMGSNYTTYKMNVKECISNGYKCTFVRIVFTLIFSILLYSLTFIYYLGNPVYITLAYVVIFLFISPLFYLSWRLFSVSTFDKYINKDNYKEIYRKGLRPLLEQITKEE